MSLRGERYTGMVILGIHAHKRTHTVVGIDEGGRSDVVYRALLADAGIAAAASFGEAA
jgi:hypothetical protein